MDTWLTWLAIFCVGIKAVPLPQTDTVSGTPINHQQSEVERNTQAFPNEHDIRSQASISSGFPRQNPNFNILPSNLVQGSQGFFSQNQIINPGGIFSGQGARGSSDLLHFVHPSLTEGVSSIEELGIGSAGFAANNDNFFSNADQNGVPGSSGAGFRFGNSNIDSNTFRAQGSFPEGFVINPLHARTRTSENPAINGQFFDQSNLGLRGFGIQNFGSNNFAIPHLGNAGFGSFGPAPGLGTAFHPFNFNGAQFGQVPFPPAVLGNAGFTQNAQSRQPQVIVHSVPVVVSIVNDTHARLSPHDQLSGLTDSQRHQLLNQERGISFPALQTSSINQSEGSKAAHIEKSNLPVENKAIRNQSNGKNIDINSGGILNVNTGEAKLKLADSVSLFEVVQTESAGAQEDPALPAPKALFAITQSPEFINKGDGAVKEDASNTNIIPGRIVENLASTGNSISTISSKNDASLGVAKDGESATVHPAPPKFIATSPNKSSTHACALGVNISESPSTAIAENEAFAATNLPGFPNENADIKSVDVSIQDILPIPEALASFASIGTPPIASGISGTENVIPLSGSVGLEPANSLIPESSALENDITTLRPQNLQIIGTGISSTTPPTTFNTQITQAAGFSLLDKMTIPALHPQTTQIPGFRVQDPTPLPVLSPQNPQVQDTLILSTTPQPTLQLQNTHITGPEVFSTTHIPSLHHQDTKSTTAGVITPQLPSFLEGIANTVSTDSTSNRDSQPVNDQSSSQPSNSTSITQLIVIPMSPVIARTAETFQRGQVIAETGTSVGRVVQIGEPVFVGTNTVHGQVEPLQSARSSLPKQLSQETATSQHNVIHKERTLQPTEQLQSLTKESHTSSAFGNTMTDFSASQATPRSSSSISQQLIASQPSISMSTISLSEPKEILQQADLEGTSAFDQSQLIVASTATSQLPGSATNLGSAASPFSIANDHTASTQLTPDSKNSNSIPALSNPPSLVIAPTIQIDNSNSHHQTDVASGATDNFFVHNQGAQPIVIVKSSSTKESATQNQEIESATETISAIQNADTFQNHAKVLSNSQNTGQVTTASPNFPIDDSGVDAILTSDTSGSSGITVKNMGSVGSGGSVTTQIPIVLSSTTTVSSISQNEKATNFDTFNSNVNELGLRTEVSNGIKLGQSAIDPPTTEQSNQQIQTKQDSFSIPRISSSAFDVQDSSFVNSQQPVSSFSTASPTLQVVSNGQQPIARTSSHSFPVKQQTLAAGTNTPTSLTQQQSSQLTNSAQASGDQTSANASSAKGNIIGQNIAQNPNIVLAIPLSLLSQSARTLNNGGNTPGSVNQIGSSSQQNSNIFQNFSFTTDPNEFLKLVTKAQAMTANAVGSASISNNVFSSNNIIDSVQTSPSNPTSIVTNNQQTSQQNSQVTQQLQANGQEQPTTTAAGTQSQAASANQQTPLSLTINHQTNGAAGRPRVVSVVSPSGSLTFLPETVARFSQALGFGVPLPAPSVVTLTKRQGTGTSGVADANRAQNGSKLGNTLKRESSL